MDAGNAVAWICMGDLEIKLLFLLFIVWGAQLCWIIQFLFGTQNSGILSWLLFMVPTLNLQEAFVYLVKLCSCPVINPADLEALQSPLFFRVAVSEAIEGFFVTAQHLLLCLLR